MYKKDDLARRAVALIADFGGARATEPSAAPDNATNPSPTRALQRILFAR